MNIPRSRLAGTIALLATLSITLGYSSTSARAVLVHNYLKQLPTEKASEPTSVAAGPNGEIYVAVHQDGVCTIDELNGLGEVVKKFVLAGSGVGSVAVDSNGDLYVPGDQYVPQGGEANGVDEFNSNGEFVRQLPGEGEQTRVAVDLADNVYIYDEGAGVVNEYSPSGAFVQQLAVDEAPAGAPEPGPFLDTSGFAVDPANGDVYILDKSSQVSSNETINEFNSSGMFIRQITGQNIPADALVEGRFQNSGGLAVDSSGDAYVSDGRGAMDEFNASGGFVAQITGNNVPGSAPVHGALGRPFGLGLDSDGDLYMTDLDDSVVDVFEYGRELADVATGSFSGLASRTVTLDGEVNPEGRTVTGCQFEYGNSTSYGSSVPCVTVSGGPVGAGSSPMAVSAQPVGLSPGVTYHYRVAATNDEGTNFGADQTLITAPGVAGSGQATKITSFAARLTGLIDPGEFTPSYHFVYGTTSAYGSSFPQPEALAGVDGQQTVSQTVTGLTPNTTYHFALVTTNFGGGESIGPDETFTTRPLVPPAVSTGGTQAVGETAVTLTGSVDPEGLPTTYHFEYGPSTGYGSSWPGVVVNAGSASAGSPVAVSVPNLQPGTTYHYRLVASNEDGTTYGADQVFSTQGYPASVVQEAPVLTANLGYINPETGPPPKSTPKALTGAQKLANALKACAKKPKKQRASCEAQAHKRYGPANKRK
jgi:hypothetical protein